MASHAARVTELEDLAPSVVQVTVAVDGTFSFRPGQWVNFRFPDGVARAYTIASPPERPDAIQLCVRVGSGRGGEALKKLEIGAEVKLDGPFGDFVLPENEDRDVVFLAGDTGIAPVRSIVLHLLATGDPRRTYVLYEPDRRNILYAGDFDPLARSGKIVHESGAIETLIHRNRRAVSSSILMAAGFDPFLERVHKALAEVDVPSEGLIQETFGPKP